MLAPKEGEMILDACSAPGGKTTELAEMMNNTGKIIACDIYKHRINLVEENAKRLGINIIDTYEQDASILNEQFIQKFDKVLIDVPCLGFGVMKRKPDIKWQRKKEDIEEISKIQFEILKSSAKYLKVGGEIVYSTCSILRNENEDIIDRWREFLKEEEIKTPIKYEIKNIEKILPNKNTDGFFICKIKRIS
ncbi:MAG: methyltransferase domain-containing protein [Clostridia bacterium]|nr:methyltransferase domain-containing protein [Clostridia bacterium]